LNAVRGKQFGLLITERYKIKFDKILDMLTTVNINDGYIYAFVKQVKIDAIRIFRFDNTDDASRFFEETEVRVINENKLITP